MKRAILREIRTTQQAILAASKEEFLAHGFEKANLRSIAHKAGVTTGAIYGYYPDKASLFDALVEAPAHSLYEQFSKASHSFEELSLEEQRTQASNIADREMSGWIGFVYDNFDAFKLIFACSSGTTWSGYADSLIKIEEESSRKYIDRLHQAGHKTQDITERVIHLLAGAFFLGITEMVLHDMKRNEAKAYIVTLCEFFTAGWLRVLNLEE